jgi:spore photoproduct lyase
MNCSYCYLQSYLNSHVTKIFTNIDQALSELSEMAASFGDHSFRVGTGEVIDSLSLDEITLYSRKLIAFFNRHPNWILEFKTKSAKVDQFLDLATLGNTTVSWSINPSKIIEKEEHGTARLHERL